MVNKNMLNLQNHPICFTSPRRLTGFSSWHEHIPFAMFLVDILKPTVILELGTYYGDSYCAFCQAVETLHLRAHCYAVDTWKGDPQTGSYGPEVLADLRGHHDPNYGNFSRLIQSAFDEALLHFGDGKIDLLHIDGYHLYEVIKHDFAAWLPKMSQQGVVLLHDINVREGTFGVWKFWDEIKAHYPHFEFLHGHGLGVLSIGKNQSEMVQRLFGLSEEDTPWIRNFFFELGHKLTLQQMLTEKQRIALSLNETVSQSNSRISDLTYGISERDKVIQEVSDSLRQKNDQIRDNDIHISSLASALRDRDAHMANLELVLKDKKTYIGNLEKIHQERGQHVQNLEQTLREKIHQIESLKAITKEKDVHISNLERAVRDNDISIINLGRQYAENYRDWQAQVGNLRKIHQDSEQNLQKLEEILNDKIHLIENLEAITEEKDVHIANLEAALKEKEIHIGSIKNDLSEKETCIAHFEASVKDKEASIRNLESLIKEKEGKLDFIYNSYGLGSLLVCNKMIDKIFPTNSKRRLFAKIILKAIKSPKIFLMSLNKKNLISFFHYVKSSEPSVLEGKLNKLVSKQTIMMHCDSAVLGPAWIEVSGWAISLKGIERVEVYCDEELLGNASYGLSRPDVHSVFPSIKGSDNSGFHLSALLEKILTSGKHNLLIKVIARDGKSSKINQSIDIVDFYQKYLAKSRPNEGMIRWMREITKNFPFRPSIRLCIIINNEETLLFLSRSLESIGAQAYPFWKILLFTERELPEDILSTFRPFLNKGQLNFYPLSELNERLLQVESDFLGFINSGDFLAPHAFFEMVKMVNMDKNIDLIYTDEDTLIGGERKEPFFKPDWSPDLFLSVNYMGRFFLLKRETFVQIGGLQCGLKSDWIHDLLLRVTEKTNRIGHIPLVLYTKGDNIAPFQQTDKEILEEALSRRGIRGEVIPLSHKGTFRVKREIIGAPKVSIIILTAYKEPNLFKNCLRSIVGKSTYENYEIVIMDNSFGKLSKKAVDLLVPASKLQMIEYKKSFNYSHMNNLATEKASGDYFIFLNDDTEVITQDWIESMLEHAQDAKVGVVGVKLLYPDERIQHAGIFLVDYGGGARHAFRFLPKDADGYRGLLKVTRNCSAVTFACVMVPKTVFLSLKGLDENLGVECNDVDFCLRAIEAGYRVVWTPFSTLYHKELTSRKTTNVLADVNYFWARWRSLLQKGDPYYNPNLTLDSDGFSLNLKPTFIEHHGPYLLNNSKMTYSKKTLIDVETIHHILVVKLDHIGDLILSLPAIRLLRMKFLKAHITMLIGSWAKPIVEIIPEIDDVITLDFFHEMSAKGIRPLNDKESEGLQQRLQERKFDLAIDLRRRPETRKYLRISGARYTVAYDTGEDAEWLSIGMKPFPDMEDIPCQVSKPHTAAQLVYLVNSIPAKDLPPIDSLLFLRPSLSPREEADLIKKYSQQLEASHLVGFHLGSGSPIKNWPVEYFAILADLLVERDQATIVLFGAKGDQHLASQFLGKVKHPEKVIQWVGKITLEEFMGLVKFCHLFIGNNSGPAHIAGVMGVPTLCIMPGEILPHEWHPLGEKTMSVRLDVPCTPCYKALPEQCPYNLKCLKFLWPEKVLNAAYHLMTISGPSEKIENQGGIWEKLDLEHNIPSIKHQVIGKKGQEEENSP